MLVISDFRSHLFHDDGWFHSSGCPDLTIICGYFSKRLDFLWISALHSEPRFAHRANYFGSFSLVIALDIGAFKNWNTCQVCINVGVSVSGVEAHELMVSFVNSILSYTFVQYQSNGRLASVQSVKSVGNLLWHGTSGELNAFVRISRYKTFCYTLFCNLVSCLYLFLSKHTFKLLYVTQSRLKTQTMILSSYPITCGDRVISV